MNENNVENMFSKLGENIYYWGFPKIIAIAHAWAMTKIMDEKHQHPYPKFH